jgi:hypothetical protein
MFSEVGAVSLLTLWRKGFFLRNVGAYLDQFVGIWMTIWGNVEKSGITDPG